MSDIDAALTSALLDQVTASLPSMVGTQLRKRLEQADKDAVELTSWKHKAELHERQSGEYHRQYESVKHSVDDTRKREAEVATRERAVQIKEAVLTEREKNVASAQSYPLAVLDKIFRERTLLSNLNLSGSLGNGGYINLVGTSAQAEPK